MDVYLYEKVTLPKKKTDGKSAKRDIKKKKKKHDCLKAGATAALDTISHQEEEVS